MKKYLFTYNDGRGTEVWHQLVFEIICILPHRCYILLWCEGIWIYEDAVNHCVSASDWLKYGVIPESACQKEDKIVV